MCIRDRGKPGEALPPCAVIRAAVRVKLLCFPFALRCAVPVSYTHLDVYKRQVWELLGKGTGYIDKIAYSIYYAGLGIHASEYPFTSRSLSFGLLVP